MVNGANDPSWPRWSSVSATALVSWRCGPRHGSRSSKLKNSICTSTENFLPEQTHVEPSTTNHDSGNCTPREWQTRDRVSVGDFPLGGAQGSEVETRSQSRSCGVRKAEPYRRQILELFYQCKGNLMRVHEELLAGGAALSHLALTALRVGCAVPPERRLIFRRVCRTPGRPMGGDDSQKFPPWRAMRLLSGAQLTSGS